MSTGDGHGYITFGWIGTIVGLLLFGALAKSYNSSEYYGSKYSQKCAEQHKAEAPSSPNITPATGDQKAGNGDNQENPDTNWCDLAAQYHMAESAMWANRAAWSSFAFTVVGVFLVWRTLVEANKTTRAAIAGAVAAELATTEARAANRIAREISEAQTRPWICFKDIQINNASNISVDGVDVGRGYQINVFFENYGQTPGVKVGILREGFSVEKEEAKYTLTQLSADGLGSAIAPPRREIKSPALAVYGKELHPFEIGRSKFIAHVFIEYKTAETDSIIRVTEFVGEVSIVGSQTDPTGKSVPLYEIAITGDANRCT
jgi:hypothetical protein